ncbi:hypothetical protein GXP71_03335 [Cellulomonas sp. H30R-01]|uniref:WD40 repeat domain-containing protein n=1 Tax=Cellulomonas sp. H30R-01 TaxID=2704467 RepID=UPI00138B55F4|nr:hypothetical protein [Cellulomonas sp. H30R-01]QHT55214.1 hypothetical protein GXP71_03335 [Cellulomonas sp. H30R-01]
MGVPVTGVLPDVQTGNPYVGPQSFRAGQHLYGRAVALDTLFNLVVAERIVLLYSPSGAGKSSLINAALIPELNREGLEVLPVVRVNTPHVATMQPPPRNRYLMSTLMSLESDVPEEQQVPLDRLRDLTLAEYLEQRPDQDGIPGNEVLVFDQFEEVLSLDPTDEDAKREFFAQVGEALRAHRLWALFAIREDHLAALEPYLRAVPTRLRTRYRLDLLTADEAFDAVVRPAQDAGVEFRAEAAHALVDDLRQVRAQRLDGTVDVLGAYVEPVQLQLACTTIWARRDPGSTEITTADGVAGGSVEQALADYYDRRVAEAARVTDVREDVIRDWFERRLITPQGLRGQVLEGPLGTAEADGPILRELEHLIRPETRRQATWYELSHDRFIEPVRRSNARWRAQHLTGFEQAAALWDENGRQRRLLLTGSHLASATADVATRRRPLQPHEREFLEASQALEADRRRDRRRRLWMRVLVLALAVLLVAAIGLYGQTQRVLDTAKADRARERTLFTALADLDQDAERAARAAVDVGRDDLSGDEPLGSNTRDLLHLAATSTPVVALLDTDGPVDVLVESLDGQTVVTVDSAVTVWARKVDDAGRTTFERAATILDGESPVAADVSADGSVVVAGLEDGTIVVWERADGSTTRWAGPAGLHTVVAAPDGRALVSLGPGTSATLWTVDGGRRADRHRVLDVTAAQAGDADAATAWPLTAAFSVDGRTLATGDDSGTVQLWDVAAGRFLRRLEVGGAVQQLRFGPGAATLGTSDDSGAVVWDVATGAKSATVTDPGLTGFVFGPDLTTVFASASWGAVQRFDVATGARDGTAFLPGTGVSGVLPDETTPRQALVLASDGRTGVWQLGDDGDARAVDVSEGVAYGVRADGTVVHSDDTGIATATPVVAPDSPWTIDADEPGARVATVNPDGTARVWDTTTGALLHEVPSGPDQPFVDDASVAGGLLALAVAGEVRLVDVATGAAVGALQPAEDAGHVELLPDGSAAVVAYAAAPSTDPATSVAEVGEVLPTAGGIPVRLRMPMARGDAPSDVAVGSGARQVAVTTQAGVLGLFDRTTGRLLWSTSLPHLRPQALAFTSDGLVVATGERGIDVVDARRGRVVREIPSSTWLDVATVSGRAGDVVVTLWGGQVVEVPLDDRGLVDRVASRLVETG